MPHPELLNAFRAIGIAAQVCVYRHSTKLASSGRRFVPLSENADLEIANAVTTSLGERRPTPAYLRRFSPATIGAQSLRLYGHVIVHDPALRGISLACAHGHAIEVSGLRQHSNCSPILTGNVKQLSFLIDGIVNCQNP